MKVRGIAASNFHALAWDESGLIYSWGSSEFGRLGHELDNLNSDEPLPKQVNPSQILYNLLIFPQYLLQIKALENVKIVQAACGYNHSIALTNTGEIYSWGKVDAVIKNTQKLSFVNFLPRYLKINYSKRTLSDPTSSIQLDEAFRQIMVETSLKKSRILLK